MKTTMALSTQAEKSIDILAGQTRMSEISPEELNGKLDAVIRQVISAERSNYLENGERARSITSAVKSIIEDSVNRFSDEN